MWKHAPITASSILRGYESVQSRSCRAILPARRDNVFRLCGVQWKHRLNDINEIRTPESVSIPCYGGDKRGLRLRRKTRSASTNSQGSALTVQFLVLFPTAKRAGTFVPALLLVELKAAKTHTVLYQINRTEYYCQVDLPLSDYPLYGKQLVASRG